MVNIRIKKGAVQLKVGQPLKGVISLNNELLICSMNGSVVAMANGIETDCHNSYGIVTEENEESYLVHFVVPEHVKKERIPDSWSQRWETKQGSKQGRLAL